MDVPQACHDVIVLNKGPYKKMIGGAYYRVYHDPQRASDLRTFDVTYIKPQIDFTKKLSPDVPSPNLIFGSIVADENLLSDDLAAMDNEKMKEVFQSAFIMPAHKIPELYLNRSLEIQLVKYFKQFGGKVESQLSFPKEEHNYYHTSSPDLVLWLKCPVTVHEQRDESDSTHEDEGESSMSGTDGEDYVAVSELKKGAHGKYQLYGEGFNVAAGYACSQLRQRKPVTSITVYCLLLVKECKYGKLAEMTINFESGECTLKEDPNEHTADECFQILASLGRLS